MIKNNLKIILAERNLSMKKLAEMTGIRYATLYAFTKTTTNSVNYTVINKICEKLNITPGDMLIYEPDKKEITQCELITKMEDGTLKE